ncbi:MAG: response regulator [Candidatus Omnitrophica bacterium]|nr:response regulator [Candidatus Omnitrophota bacterium]
MDKKRILIVDDEPDFGNMVKMILEHTNEYKVLALQDAKNLIYHVHAFNPQCVLLDLLMPGIGGMEAIEILNNDPVGKITPIIVLSALDKKTDKVKAFSLGVVDYLVKPVENSQIIASIERAIKSKSV